MGSRAVAAGSVDPVTEQPRTPDDPAEEPVEEPVAGAGPLRDDDIVDELPEDLDLTGFVGAYTFPNNNRRRIPAAIYLVMGLGCIALWAAYGDSSLVNAGILVAGAGLVLFAVYGFVAGVTMRIDETDALVAASQQVGFAVGHASAQQVWHGWLSRPTWRILLYSAENPPKRRGIVLLDAVDGHVMEWFAEDNPEDWSDLDGSLTA
jgi:hypothetical protein